MNDRSRWTDRRKTSSKARFALLQVGILLLCLGSPVQAGDAKIHVTTTDWEGEGDADGRLCSLSEAINLAQGEGPSAGCVLEETADCDPEDAIPQDPCDCLNILDLGELDVDSVAIKLQGSVNSGDDCPDEDSCFFTYKAQGAYPTVTKNLIIDGAHATIERAAGDDHRFFKVDGGRLNLSKVILKGGGATRGGAIKATGQPPFDPALLCVEKSTLVENAAERGGAIFGESLSLVILGPKVRFSDNFALKKGGAVFVKEGGLVSYRSTFDGNEASLTDIPDQTASSMGGAIYSDSSVVHIENTTFSENRAGSGGAWYSTGTSPFPVPGFDGILVKTSTFKDNRSIDDGSAIASDGSSVIVQQSALDCPENECAASFCLADPSAFCEVDLCSGDISSDGDHDNVAEDSSCGDGDWGEIVEDLPLTEELDFHGGPVPVYAITCGPPSEGDCPLIDKYACEDVLDGRGVKRGEGGLPCDIGAYEAICNLEPPKPAGLLGATTFVGVQVGEGKEPGVGYSVYNSPACGSIELEDTTETLEWYIDLNGGDNPEGFVWLSRVIFLRPNCEFDCVEEPSRCRQFCGVEPPPSGFDVPAACSPDAGCPGEGLSCCQTFPVGVEIGQLNEESYAYMIEFGTDIPGESAGDWDPEMRQPPPD